jgi:hypothetical protein
MGALDLSHFYPAPISMDSECRVHNEFSKELQKPMAELVDAFLYLHPERLGLKEQIPADIVLDSKYWAELKRRETLQGFPASSAEQIVIDAESPFLDFPTAEETKALMQGPLVKQDVQECLAWQFALDERFELPFYADCSVDRLDVLWRQRNAFMLSANHVPVDFPVVLREFPFQHPGVGGPVAR